MNKDVMNNSVHKYGKDITWSLPCFFQNEVIFGTMQAALEAYRFPFLNANIFGAPKTNWTAGRVAAIRDEFDIRQFKKLFNYIQNENNGTPTFTFSRLDISEELLKDTYANYILDFSIERGARFIVSSDRLKDYIKSKKSDATVVASVMKPISKFHGKENIEQLMTEEESDYYNKLLKEYDIVVVRPEYARDVLVKDPSIINDISRIEILINQVCINNCPMASEHIRLIQESNIKAIDEPVYSNDFYCPKYQYSRQKNYQLNCTIPYNITKKLVDAGVKHLKLQGRGEPIQWQKMLFLLASQMFNFDGPNYVFLEHLINILPDEFEKFKVLVDQENKWPNLL